MNNGNFTKSVMPNAVDRVGDRQVFRTPSANVAVAMANLDRLTDTPENHMVREDIKAYLTTAMAKPSSSPSEPELL
jgi:hypothetical protein